MFSQKPNRTADEALVSAMFRLRMNTLGFTSYSGTPSRIDEGWAALVRDTLADYGYTIAPASATEARQGEDPKGLRAQHEGAAPRSGETP
jgi:hypothetical protein